MNITTFVIVFTNYKNGSSRNHGAFVKIEDFKMLKFRRIV